MRRSITMLLTAVLSISAIPAMGAWSRIGSLDVAAGKTSEFLMENFSGNTIGLTARDSDVMCDRVAALYASGEMRPIFRGRLPKGLSIRVDLPPGVIERVTFDCHATQGTGATIDLAADTGAASKAQSG